MMKNNVKQILLLGCDVTKTKDFYEPKLTDKEKYVRSDSMIVALINKETSSVALVSLMRDIWVDIEGFGQDRINTAIVKGGPRLAVKTVNQYFNLDIDSYIVLNMESLVDIVDEIGGIDINLNDDEIYYINEEINNAKRVASRSLDTPCPILDKAGINHLNGLQTLAHVRDRYFGFCWKRGERQRDVLKAMINKVKKDTNKKKMAMFGLKMLRYVKTNLSPLDIIELAKIAINVDPSKIKTHCVPTEGTYNMVNDGVWRFEIDFIENSRQLQELINSL